MVLLNSVALLLVTMEKYLLMDSVVVDFSDPEQSYLPESLEFSKKLDPSLLDEFLDIVEKTPWVAQKEIPKDNLTASTYKSEAYNNQRMYLFRIIYKGTFADAADGLYIKSRMHDNWSSAWTASKILEYGGKDKFVMWNKSAGAMGGLFPSRDFITYNVRIGCDSELMSVVRNRTSMMWHPKGSDLLAGDPLLESTSRSDEGSTAGEEGDCLRRGPMVFLFTNASNTRFDHSGSEQAERCVFGTSGVYIQGISEDPPLTYFQSLHNGNFKTPAVVPDGLTRRFFIAMGLTMHKEFKAFLQNRLQKIQP